MNNLRNIVFALLTDFMMKLFNRKFLLFIFILGISHFAFAQRAAAKLQKLDNTVLQSVYDTTNIKKSNVTINPRDFRNTRHVRILTKKSNTIIRGKLVSYNEYGLFVYESKFKLLGFYPFKNLKKVKIGRSYGHLNIILASAGAIVGGIALSYDYHPVLFPVGMIVGAGATAFYTQIFGGPLHGIYKIVYQLNWNLNEKKTSKLKFYQFLKDHPEETFFIAEFEANTENTSSIDVVKSENRTEKNKIEPKSDSSSNSAQTVVDLKKESLNENVKVVQKLKFLEGQSFGDDKNIKAKWIFTDFNSSNLNESDIQAVFKNIRGLQLSRKQLSKYNTSQIQFLAMMICSGGGYNMKNTLTLTEKQRKFLGTYESGYPEDINIEGTISTMNLSDIDLENLKVIFAELGDR